MRTEGSPEISFSWIDCKRVDEPHFVVEIWKEGKFRYVGKNGVRELGERNGVLTKAQAHGMFRAVKQFERVRDGKAQYVPDVTGAETLSSQYCLSTTDQTNPERSNAIANFDSKAAIEFNEAANVATAFRRYVCPGRQFNFYGQDGACEASDVAMIYDESGECRVRHIVHLYREGIVHYYAEDVSGTDQYASVGKEVASELIKKAKAYKITGTEGTTGDGWALRGTENELRDFRSLVARDGGIVFFTPPAGDSRCKTRLGPGQLHRSITF